MARSMLDRRSREVAVVAARLMQEQGLDFLAAKKKAAQSLGLGDRAKLPANREVEQALLENQRLFFDGDAKEENDHGSGSAWGNAESEWRVASGGAQALLSSDDSVSSSASASSASSLESSESSLPPKTWVMLAFSNLILALSETFTVTVLSLTLVTRP